MNSKSRYAQEALLANNVGYSIDRFGMVKLHITSEYDLIGQISNCEKLVKDLVKAPGDLAVVKADKIRRRKYIHTNRLGNNFLQAMRSQVQEIRLHFASHKFNPYFELFVTHVKARHLEEVVNYLNFLPNDEEVYKWCDIINSCARSIVDEAESAVFKKKVNEFHNSANKNERELRQHFKKLADGCDSVPLEVSRFDVTFRKPIDVPAIDIRMSYEDVKSYWANFIKYLNKNLPSGCFIGYAWRLTSTLDSSFIYHFVTFVHPEKVPDNVIFDQAISIAWDAVTTGKGLVYDCRRINVPLDHPSPFRFKSCGIGMTNDPLVREGLEYAAFYMTQLDYHMKYSPSGNGRALGKSVLPTLKQSEPDRPKPKKKLKETVTGSNSASLI